LLIRANTKEAARVRIQKIVDFGGTRVEVLCSDLAEENLGLQESEYAGLLSRTTHILHAAASVRFTHPLEDARRNNVKTTEQMIDFAKECSNLVRFGFVSSALVAGNRTGLILEDEFEHDFGFKNTYEQTKYEAEALVRENAKELPIVIFRPPLIVTSVLTQDANTPTNFLELAVSLITRNCMPFVPGTENSTVDVVDGGDAAYRICEILLKNNLSYMAYHITNGINAPTIKIIHAMIEQKLGTPVPLEFCGDIATYWQRVHKIPWYKPAIRLAYKRTASFLPEAAFPKIFDNRNTLSELKVTQVGKDPIEVLRLLLYKGLWNFSA
jgi:thioester reductase-like protein